MILTHEREMAGHKTQDVFGRRAGKTKPSDNLSTSRVTLPLKGPHDEKITLWVKDKPLAHTDQTLEQRSGRPDWQCLLP